MSLLSDDLSRTSDHLSEKVLWSVVGVTLVGWSFQLFAYVDTFRWVTPVQLSLAGVGIVLLLTSWAHITSSPRIERLVQHVGLVAAMAGFAVWALMQVRTAPGYGTDEMAFNQYAGQIAAHFHNPYPRSMAPAFPAFDVSPNGYTFNLNGAPVTALSYPALSFLIYVPFLWLHLHAQLGVVVNVVAWIIAAVTAYRLLPTPLKPVPILLSALGVFMGYSVGGVTDVVYLTPLMLAVHRFDQLGDMAISRVRWKGVALGLALSVKQTPWIMLPFLVGAIFVEERRRAGTRPAFRVLVDYLGPGALAFALVNAPFALTNPHAWLRGILTPLQNTLVPAGQGIISLALYLGIGGGQLRLYGLSLAAAAVTAWLAFIATYPRFKALTILGPGALMLLAARSFDSYLLMPVLPGLVAMSGLRPREGTTPRISRRLAFSAVGSAVAAASLAAVALVSRAPLTVDIQSVRTTGQLATIVQIDAQVTNTTSRTLRPTFTIDQGGSLTAFWNRVAGPTFLAPHHRAHYTLLAPNFFAQPPLTGGFQLMAFTSSPATVAVSAPFVANQHHVQLLPRAVNRTVPIGRPVEFRAQVVNTFNQPVRRAGIVVYLGQIVYTQSGLAYGQAVINGQPVGATPVQARTDAAGRVTFLVMGTVASHDPVYFEANLTNDVSRYPYGYSDIVPIRFGPTRTGATSIDGAVRHCVCGKA